MEKEQMRNNVIAEARPDEGGKKGEFEKAKGYACGLVKSLLETIQSVDKKIEEIDKEVTKIIRQKVIEGYVQIYDEELYRIIEMIFRKAEQPHDEYLLYMNIDGIFLRTEDHLHNEQGIYIETRHVDHYLDDILRTARNIGMDYLERVLRALLDFLSSL